MFIFLVLYLKSAESRGMVVNYTFVLWYSYILYMSRKPIESAI